MIVIRWSRLSSSVCISGYIIKIQEDVKGGAKIERFVDANVDKFALTPLQSCRQYVVTMQAYLGRFPESKSPIFAGKNSVGKLETLLSLKCFFKTCFNLEYIFSKTIFVELH